MSVAFAISDEVRRVLSEARIDESTVQLTQQLPRPLYVAVNKVLEGAGGKWNRKLRAHVFSRDPREVLGLAIETGEAVNVQQQLQAFYTPRPLALRLARLANLRSGSSVLEPSAGLGALVDAAQEVEPALGPVVCVEIDPVAAGALRQRRAVIEADFLSLTPADLASHGAPFDRILMNPPFTKGQDVAHVTHALRFLKPGGRLVAIMSPSWQHVKTKAAEKFRETVKDAEVEDLPPGTFSEAGTDARAVLVVIDAALRAPRCLACGDTGFPLDGGPLEPALKLGDLTDERRQERQLLESTRRWPPGRTAAARGSGPLTNAGLVRACKCEAGLLRELRARVEAGETFTWRERRCSVCGRGPEGVAGQPLTCARQECLHSATPDDEECFWTGPGNRWGSYAWAFSPPSTPTNSPAPAEPPRPTRSAAARKAWETRRARANEQSRLAGEFAGRMDKARKRAA